MATTTPNYGWSVPTSSDLVKNGATAIETLGDSVDASLWNVGYGQAGKNKIINGDLGIWQRGTTFTPSATGYFMFADRFRSYTYSASATTATQQAFTPGTAPVAGYEGTYFGRVVSTNTFSYFSYNGIENVRTFAGQTVTLSYWAKSASAQTLNEVQVSQFFGTGGSATVNTNLTPPTITTSWVRYSHTFTMPSVTGKTIASGNDSIKINIKGEINNALDMWGFQLEAGSQMTPFQTASGGSPQAELAMCQRYYWRAVVSATGQKLGTANVESTTTSDCMITFPVTMRTNPTALETSGTAADYSVRSGGSATNCNAVPSFLSSSTSIGHFQALVASGLTTGYSGSIRAANANAYLGWSAEL